jgi:hypothetical protein
MLSWRLSSKAVVGNHVFHFNSILIQQSRVDGRRISTVRLVEWFLDGDRRPTGRREFYFILFRLLGTSDIAHRKHADRQQRGKNP